MESTNLVSPILVPFRMCDRCGAIDMDSMPPATMTLASPLAICCKPSATDRRPEPQSWFMPHAVFSCGMPAAMAACRAGFCPSPPARTWPRMTSSTSSGETLARSSAPLIATAPSSWAVSEPSAPLNAPTGVRAADTITTSVMINSSFSVHCASVFRVKRRLAGAPLPRSRHPQSLPTPDHQLRHRSPGSDVDGAFFHRAPLPIWRRRLSQRRFL